MKTGELSNLQPERTEPVQFVQVCLVISMAFHNTTLIIYIIHMLHSGIVWTPSNI